MKKGFYSAPLRPASRHGDGRTSTVTASRRTQRSQKRRASTWRSRYKRHEKPLLFLAGVAAAVALVAVHASLTPGRSTITQDDIDQAVQRTLETKAVPSPAMKAYQAVRSSIVRVRAIGDGLEQDE